MLIQVDRLQQLATRMGFEPMRAMHLFHLVGPVVQDLYETLVALEGEEGKDVYDITVGRLNNYFAPKCSKTFERHLFWKIIQQAGETCDQFLTRLQ